MAYFNQNGSSFDEVTGRWTHNFSQSFIGGFQHCAESARADYFKEIPKDDYTDSTALGTAAHEGAEYALHEKRAGRVATLADTIEVAEHCLEEIGEWKHTKLSDNQMWRALPRMCEGFLRDVLPQVDPAVIEQRFNVKLYEGKHRTVNLVGTMDCVDQHYEPWDWKTAARAHDVWEKQRWAVQPTAYCYAVQAMNNEQHVTGEMVDATFVYGVMLHNGDTQVYRVSRGNGHVAWLKKVASQIAWMIEHEVNPWPLNDGGWWCSDKWCPLWSECKGKDMPEGWMQAPR